MVVLFKIGNLPFGLVSASSFSVEELYICWLNIIVYIGAIVVTARRIKDISETSPLPCWPFTLTLYTLTFAGRIWSQIL